MVKWVPYAFVRITIFFIGGILLGIYTDQLVSRQEAFYLAVIISGLYLILWVVLRKKAFTKFNVAFSIVGFLTFTALGYFNLSISNQSLDDNNIINLPTADAYIGSIAEPATETDKSYRYLVKVSTILSNSKWIGAEGKVYVYMSKADSSQFKYGDQLLIHGHPELLNPPANPGEFDYKRFLSFQNIYHNDFVHKNQITLIGENKGNYLMTNALKIRHWATETLSSAIVKPRERNIALALILGVKDGLDDDIKNAYSASGAMHVLAVSGLHVGIIYAIILLLFSKLNSTAAGRWLFAGLALSSLWTYAAVTGFSPSVLRAVTMFSFIALSKASGRNTNIYNTLAASAFALLIYNPYLIMSVGFQLSFLAVLGIVYLQPKIYSSFVSKYFIVDKIWAITSVAIAAQLATFPLGLLYFHQFPTFFFLSNLIVIPGAFIILIGGIGILMSSPIPVLYEILGSILERIIYYINELVFVIKDIPHSQLTDIYITTPQSWLIIGSLLMFVLLLQYRNIRYLYAGVTLVFVFSYIQWTRIADNNELNKMTFYRVNGNTAIDFISAGNSQLFTDQDFWNDANRRRFHVTPNHLKSGVQHATLFPQTNSHHTEDMDVLYWHGKSIIILDNKINKRMMLKKKVKCDIILLGKSFNGKLDWLMQRFEFDKVFLDGSLSKFTADRLREEATKLSLNCYSIYHEGAIEVRL
ncbi:MAG TPA: ComEC/Rec2 family competence protein [Fulvivirga sp.]|nr:ComEC/Rec2 family competence protein [Fulvivirga sp.]